jgi:HSP20 family protein
MNTATDPMERLEKRFHKPTLCPAADVREADDHFLVVLELPGVRSEDVHLEVEGDELRLTANRSLPNGESSYLLRERSEGTFGRIFRLSDVVDREGITGKLTDGVLTVLVPKSARALARKVKIA